MAQDVFLRDDDFYTRDLNHVVQYINQTGFYVSKMKSMPIEQARQKVRAIVKASIHNPTVVYYERGDNLDKNKVSTTLLGYLQSTFNANEILAPTFTTYQSPSVFVAPFSGFMVENKENRGKYKKQEKIERMRNNTAMAVFYNKEQNNAKAYNNGGSGCYGSKGSILFNPTCHSTLTSSVRTQTSISNASNERLLEGNRHYRNTDIILNNLISICSDFDRDLLQKVLHAFNIVCPTAQDVLDVIDRSHKLYVYDKNGMTSKIVPFVNKLDGIERAAFVYTGDLYHLNKYNPNFIMTLLDKISEQIKPSIEDLSMDKPESFLHTYEETIVNHVLQLFCEHTVGVPRDEYVNKFSKELLCSMSLTAKNVTDILNSHKDFIRAFFLTKHVPPSSSYIYSQIRRAIVGSDTDATIFSVDTLVNKRFGTLEFTTASKAFASSISLFTTKIIAHQLAMLCANLGVIKKDLSVMAMKPEFTFPIYAQTPVPKHYYTVATVQEGMHFDEPKYKYEEKGVHLKNSAHPQEIISSATSMMRTILMDLYKNKPLYVGDKIQEVIDLEKEIKRSLLSSETTYYKKADIKTADSYRAPPNLSNYRFHTLWTQVFESTYGAVEDPNYISIKVPLAINNTHDIKKWITTMENKDIAQKLAKWLADNGRKDFRTVMLSATYVHSYGIPKEIASVMDYKRVILDLTMSRRMVLSSLGIYPKPKMTMTEMYEGSI